MPELFLFGHTHKIGTHEPDGDFDYYGYQSCTDNETLLSFREKVNQRLITAINS